MKLGTGLWIGQEKKKKKRKERKGDQPSNRGEKKSFSSRTMAQGRYRMVHHPVRHCWSKEETNVRFSLWLRLAPTFSGCRPRIWDV